jgi:hypothetical protein
LKVVVPSEDCPWLIMKVRISSPEKEKTGRERT